MPKAIKSQLQEKRLRNYTRVTTRAPGLGEQENLAARPRKIPTIEGHYSKTRRYSRITLCIETERGNLPETHLRSKDKYKLKRMEKYISLKWGEKAGIPILIADQKVCKTKAITRDTKGHFILIKGFNGRISSL